MLNFNEARRAILRAVKEPGTETIPVRESLGRVLARDLTVPRDYPDTRRSAVDGYALRFGDGESFQLVGEVAAGEIPDCTLEPGQCVMVMTGGTVPERANCVVKVEDCEKDAGRIRVQVAMEPGTYINEPGSETTAGTPLLQAGARLNHGRYSALFYAGISEVEVYKRPRVAVLITGEELREVEDEPAPGKAFNTNRYILESVFSRLGVSCAVDKWIPDRVETTRQALNTLSESCQFVVSSGAVSMGRYDYIKDVFQESDFSLVIEGTAIKPGSPLLVAERSETLFFGMPGYPSAFLTNALLYLVPALKKACGRIDFDHVPIEAELATPMHARRGRLDACRATLEVEDGRWFASDPGSQTTSHFLNFAKVNGLVLLPESMGDQPVGAEVKALCFDLELT